MEETTASAISRIESGRHATSLQTLKKLGAAFGARAVFGSSSARQSIPSASW